MQRKVSRRALLAGAITLFPLRKLLAGPASPSPSPSPDAIAGLDVLSPAEWRTLEALVDQIWPRVGAVPSASEAGALTYLHRRFTGKLPGYHLKGAPPSDAPLVALYRRLLERTDELSRELSSRPFVALPLPERKRVVARLATGSKADVGYHVVGIPSPAAARDPDLFALVRRHVLEGTFSDPRSGGNRDFRAWEGIGHTCHTNYPREHRCDPAKKQHR